MIVLAAATILGIPETVIVGLGTAIVTLGGTWLSARQARSQSHDQVLATRETHLWDRMVKDNLELRGEMATLRHELREAEDRIDQLEAGMRAANVPIPPRLVQSS
jgi:uncharacterized protein YlxW (UPF0749 family)